MEVSKLSNFEWDERGYNDLRVLLEESPDEMEIGCVADTEIDCARAQATIIGKLNSKERDAKWSDPPYRISNSGLIVLRNNVRIIVFTRKKLDMFFLGNPLPTLVDFTKSGKLFNEMRTELKKQMKKEFPNGLKL